jgi:hypothetical protein
MSDRTVHLDPPPYTWRTRKITFESYQWYAKVELNREGYVDSHRDIDTDLPEQVMAAVDRLRRRAMDRLWLAGYPGGFSYGEGSDRVTLFVEFRHIDETVEALRAAELEHDPAGLDALAQVLALPVEDWLAPGERQLLRGVDFDVRPTVFLRFLRGKAREQGLRLNGRATADDVWVRPQLTATDRMSRQAFPEQYADRPDRWSDAPPSDGPWRPFEERRNRGGSTDAEPVEIRRLNVKSGGGCPCGFRDATDDYFFERHRRHHLQWSLGVPVPKNLPWEIGNIALVTTRSSIGWRRLAYQVALLPKRENGYDFPSWDVGEEPADDPRRKRVYLLRDGRYVVGYLTVSDLDGHAWWDFNSEEHFGERDDSVRPCIDLIWVAAVHRGRGLAGALVELLAEDFGCQVGDVSWSHPVSAAGQRLARRISPGGIWVR